MRGPGAAYRRISTTASVPVTVTTDPAKVAGSTSSTKKDDDDNILLPMTVPMGNKLLPGTVHLTGTNGGRTMTETQRRRRRWKRTPGSGLTWIFPQFRSSPVHRRPAHGSTTYSSTTATILRWVSSAAFLIGVYGLLRHTRRSRKAQSVSEPHVGHVPVTQSWANTVVMSDSSGNNDSNRHLASSSSGRQHTTHHAPFRGTPPHFAQVSKVVFSQVDHGTPVSHPKPWDHILEEPDYGDLELRFLEVEGQPRVLYHDFDLDHSEIHRWTGDDFVEYYFAFDDDHERNPYKAYDDHKIAEERHCRRVRWHRNYKINCNAFHELDLGTNVQHNVSKFLGYLFVV
jgi:hypothetical protein